MNTTSGIEAPSEWEIASMKKMISYSFGFIISSYLVSSFIVVVFYFYEVEIGLPINLVGLVFIIFAIWSMVNYPLLGYLTDRPFPRMKKWGLRFPWIMISAVLSLLFYFLIFTPPIIDVKKSPWQMFWYILIISCIFDTFYTIFTLHFIGSFANQFREDFERRKVIAITLFIPGIILFFMGLIWPLTVVYGNRWTFTLAAIIAISTLLVCIIIFIPGISESEEIKARYFQGRGDQSQYSFLKIMKVTFHQKNFIITIIVFILTSVAAYLILASNIYFFKDILGLPLYYSIYTNMAYFFTLMAAIPFWLIFSINHGHVKTYILGLFLTGLSLIPFLWITTLEEAIIFSILRGFADSASYIVLLMVLSDVYDEVTLATGKHQEATLQGIHNFFTRTAVILQAVIIATIHIATGYSPNPHAVQTANALWGIRIQMALIPAICHLLAGIIVLLFYDLKGEKQKVLKNKLRELGL